MASLLATLMVIYMWGACNAYLVIMGDVFSSLGRAAAGTQSYFADRSAVTCHRGNTYRTIISG